MVHASAAELKRVTRRRCGTVFVALGVLIATTTIAAQVLPPRNLRIVRSGEVVEPPPVPVPYGRLVVMTWNIHFGKTAGDVLNLEAQAQVMANSNADVILLQEASTWDGDQPNRFPQLLQSYTGRTWYKYWVSATTSGTGQGLLFLSRLPIVTSAKINIEGTGFGRIGIDANGIRVNVVNAHLEAYDTAKRTRQLNALMTWARQVSAPRLVGGDFNAWWGESWIRTMETEYSDTWQDVTGSDQNGYTIGNVRFDYLFRAPGTTWLLPPAACVVVPTSASDHRPVVAEYVLR